MQRSLNVISNVFYSFVLIMAVSAPLIAQEFRGTIAGRVVDPSGSVVPGVAISITHIDTGQILKILSNDSGQYVAPLLSPGQYRVEAELAGFKRFVQENIELQVNDRLQVDIVLQIGELNQTVVVTAGTPLLEATDGSAGMVVDSKRISELPIAHGNPYLLIGMAPGTNMDGDQKLNRPYEPTHIVGYSVSGSRANTSDVTLDGVANTALSGTGQVTASYVPPTDAIGEFKVQTASFDAKVGQTSGGVVNIGLKSGTNKLHGTGYYTKMTPGMTANDFFANQQDIPRGEFTYDRWGASLNGPVLLPKLYNGHSRTFFMTSYEGLRDVRPRGDTYTVPTEKERAGDLSELLAISSRYQIYNPFTRRQISSSRYQQDPFAGNIIPQNLINPVSKKIMEYVPKPINAGTTADHLNNLPVPNLPELTNYYTWVSRIDHTLSQRQRFFIRANIYKRDTLGRDWYNSEATGRREQYFSRGASLDDVWNLSTTMIMNFRYGYNRFMRQTSPKNGWGFDLTSLGFPAALNNAISPKIRMFPYIRVRESGTQDSITSQSIGEDRNMDTHSFVVAFTKMYRSHTFEFGTEFRAYRHNRYMVTTPNSGSYQFDRTYTRGPLDNSSESPFGQGMASFLLGIPNTSTTLTRTSNFAEQSMAWAFYFQDLWRVTPRLNLNIGLRYELETPLTERYNRSVRGFDLNAVPSIAAAAEAAYALNPVAELPPTQFKVRGGLTFAGVNGQPRGLWKMDKNNFMPRFGFAYAVNRRTILRGGYGIYFGFLGVRRTDVNQLGWARTTTFAPTTNSGMTFRFLDNPFPNGILEPQGNTAGIETELGNSISFFNGRPRAPYMQRWQLSFQRELPSKTLFEISYVGNRGTKLESSSGTKDYNAIPNQYLSRSITRDQSTIDYLSGNIPNPFYNLVPGTVGQNNRRSRGDLLRPYPQFSSSMRSSNNNGYSWYHAMLVRLDKRFAAGVTANLALSWSKFMEAVDYLNPSDPRPYECISPQDHTFRISTSSIYELPIGRNKRFFSSLRGWKNRIFGGWQMQGIYVYQTGSPLTWSASTTLFTGKFSDLTAGERTIDRWFNVDAGFLKDTATAPNTSYQLRYWPLRFSSIRADSTNNWDMSLLKNVLLREGVRIQFKAEFLNAFNHASFRAPVTDPYNLAFGQVTDTANYARHIQIALKLIF